MKTNRRIISFAIILLLSIILIACMKPEPIDSKGPRSLKILGSKSHMENLIPYFDLTYNNINIEFIDATDIQLEAFNNMENYEDRIKEIITGPNSPDLIFLDVYQLVNYQSEGLIIPLDSFIKKNDFDLKQIYPPVVDALKDLGDGSIYAFAPNFSTRALYYNKTMFDKRNIPYPHDRMSWDEIFDLAKQFAHEENEIKYYGLAFDFFLDEHRKMEYYFQPLNFSVFNEDFTSLTLSSPEWVKIWEIFTQLHKEGVIAPSVDLSTPKGITEDDEHFLYGRAAMQVGWYNNLLKLEAQMSGQDPSGDSPPEIFDWDMVSLPIHLEVGDVGGMLSFYDMMAINSKSDQADLAWEFISFMHSDRMLNILTETGYTLPSRLEMAQQYKSSTKNLKAFTLLKPSLDLTFIEFKKLYPNAIPHHVYDIGNQLFRDVVEGKLSVEEALEEYQTKGQQILDRIIEEHDHNG